MKRACIAIAATLLFALGCSNSNGSSSGSSGGIGPSMGDGEIPGSGGNGGAEKASAGPAAPGSASDSPSSAGGTGTGTGTTASDPTAPTPSPAPVSDAGAPPDASPDASPRMGEHPIPAGVLTTGAWDDNRNFERFLQFRSELWNKQTPGLLPLSEAEHRAATAMAVPGAKSKLDIQLVIDTTGSMTDELGYLQREFDAIAATIQSKYPSSQQRWSLVVYRDATDPYIVRWFDFRDNTADFRAKLGEQRADGGGDFPEAVDQALDTAQRLSWREDAQAAKVMFWVADAPHHNDKALATANAIRAARDKSIHIYPVAGSGVDDLTELSMRSAAQLTGGRYLFLTDDSRVGGAHKAPRIPCYFVTKLDRAILRMVDIELSGQYREPDAADIVRKGGDPQSGACQLAEGNANAY